MASTTDAPQSFPISEALHGGPLPPRDEFASAIDPICESIQARIDQNFALVLRGRVDGVRVDFSPLPAGLEFSREAIANIRYRLQTACHRGGLTTETEYDDRDPRQTCEWLLRLLVRLNRVFFEDIRSARGLKLIPGDELWMYENHFNNCLTWLGNKLERFNGLSKAQEDEIVRFIMQELREHIRQVGKRKTMLTRKARRLVEEVNGGHLNDRTWMWCLHSPHQGFEKRLRDCFKRDGLRSEDYEDLLEQQFYGLRRFAEDTERPRDDGDHLELEKWPEG